MCGRLFSLLFLFSGNALALEHHGADGEILLVQQDKACFLARIQRAAALIDADGLCRIQRAGAHGVVEGDVKLDGLTQAAHETGDGACQRLGVAGDGGAVAMDLDLLTAEGGNRSAACAALLVYLSSNWSLWLCC